MHEIILGLYGCHQSTRYPHFNGTFWEGAARIKDEKKRPSTKSLSSKNANAEENKTEESIIAQVMEICASITTRALSHYMLGLRQDAKNVDDLIKYETEIAQRMERELHDHWCALQLLQSWK